MIRGAIKEVTVSVDALFGFSGSDFCSALNAASGSVVTRIVEVVQ